MRKKQKHQTPNTETQVPITKSIITERIFRLSILMFVMRLKFTSDDNVRTVLYKAKIATSHLEKNKKNIFLSN